MLRNNVILKIIKIVKIKRLDLEFIYKKTIVLRVRVIFVKSAAALKNLRE